VQTTKRNRSYMTCDNPTSFSCSRSPPWILPSSFSANSGPCPSQQPLIVFRNTRRVLPKGEGHRSLDLDKSMGDSHSQSKVGVLVINSLLLGESANDFKRIATNYKR